MFLLETHLFQELSKHLYKNSKYKKSLLVVIPSVDTPMNADDKNAIIEITQIDCRNYNHSLDYENYLDLYSFQVNVYTRKIGNVDSVVVAKQLAYEIKEFVVKTMHMKLENFGERPNREVKISRYLLTFSCLFDDDKKTIYSND